MASAGRGSSHSCVQTAAGKTGLSTDVPVVIKIKDFHDEFEK